jgi:hypothetical protein
MEFPKEVLFTLLTYVKVEHLVNFANTCKSFRQLIFSSIRKLHITNFLRDKLIQHVCNCLFWVYLTCRLNQRRLWKYLSTKMDKLWAGPSMVCWDCEVTFSWLDMVQQQYNSLTKFTSLHTFALHSTIFSFENKMSFSTAEAGSFRIELSFLSQLTKVWPFAPYPLLIY